MFQSKKRLSMFLFVMSSVILSCLFPSFILLSIIKMKENSTLNDNQSYDYQVIKIDGVNPTQTASIGFVSLIEQLKPNEFIFYENINNENDYVLISNFGEEEYQCIGTCFCEEEIELLSSERRSSSLTLTRGVLYLLTALTSIVAVAKAKEYFEDECKSALRDVCPFNSINSDVEKCEKILPYSTSSSDDLENNIEHNTLKVYDENDQKNGNYRKYFCQGYCVSKPFQNERERSNSETMNCQQLKNDGILTLYNDEIENLIQRSSSDNNNNNELLSSKKEQLLQDSLNQKFDDSYMRSFCRDESMKDYLYETSSEVIETRKNHCKSSLDSIYCVQTYPPQTLEKLKPGNTDMVIKLKQMGRIATDLTFKAFLGVDRADFCDLGDDPDPDLRYDAYGDHPQPIGSGATISAPHMHAFAVDTFNELIVRKNYNVRILDVGSGSGYLVSVFAHIVCPHGGKVLGLELEPTLVEKSIRNLQKDDQVRYWMESGCIEIIEGNGWEGSSGDDEEEEDEEDQLQVFDVIHVGAAASDFPEQLVEQLAPGGRMVIPVGKEYGAQYIYIIDKDLEGNVHEERSFGVRYVPLRRDY